MERSARKLLHLRKMVDDTYRYRSTVVAGYIVALANERRVFVNLTKAQKLLYIAYGLYMAVRDARLTDEHPQAWPFGPVFPKTRKSLLKRDLSEIDAKDAVFDGIRADEDVNGLMDLVFRTYGRYNAAQLTEWSHKPGSPWDRATRSPGFKWGDQVHDVDISEYFKSIIVRDA